jgi:phage FluMu protein Com
MPQTIQCNFCGVILNLPPHVKAGKRLKCPRCGSRFAISESEASSASTFPGMADATPMSAYELPKPPAKFDDLPTPLAEGDLRETFDLPLISGREAERGEAVSDSRAADAAALFNDSGAAKRRLAAAEARANARRCTQCNGFVPKGMSICVACGTDQETGLRVGLEDDLAPPPPPPPEGPPFHVALIGGLTLAGCVIMLIVGIVQSARVESTLENAGWLSLAVVCALGIYASIQFMRAKSAKLLILAMTLGAGLDVIALIGAPIIQPNFDDQDQIVHEVRPDDPDVSDIGITPFADRLNFRRIALGITLILVYTVLSLYLISPPVKRFIHARGERSP